MQVLFGADGVTVCLRNRQPRPHFKETVERLMEKGFEVALWTYCFPYAYQVLLRDMSLPIPVLPKRPQTLPSSPHIIVDALRGGVPVNSESRVLIISPFVEWKGNDSELQKVSWEICKAWGDMEIAKPAVVSTPRQESPSDRKCDGELMPEDVFMSFYHNYKEER